MKRIQAEHFLTSNSFKDSPQASHSVTQLIRLAEKYSAAGKHSLALEQLSVAQELEPHNKYIEAIIERVRVLQRTERRDDARNDYLSTEPELDANRYLSVTVGAEFDKGIKAFKEESLPPPTDLQVRIKRLTDIAEELLQQGLYESAFDSLMKAYLLDPISPYVISCEKIVLPAWGLNHTKAINAAIHDHDRRLSSTSQSSGKGPQEAKILMPQQKAHPINTRESSPQKTELPVMNSEQRLKILKERMESERREKERAIWREASSLPKMFEDGSVPKVAESPVPESVKTAKGFFGMFKRGKPQ